MDAFAAHGCRAEEIIVARGPQSADGHDPGSGRLANDDVLVCDLFPRDDASGCFADMTRTFTVGTPDPEIVAWHGDCLEALELAREMTGPGVNGADVYEAVCAFFEERGHPTRRSVAEGEVLREGFNHGLGHGVGLDVHEAPYLGKIGHDLVVGDVITLEPGLYRHGFGGVRVEDLVLVTEDGCETITRFPHRARPRFGRGRNGRMSDDAIQTLLAEERRFPPDPSFAAQANAKPDIYGLDPDAFWEAEGRKRVSWFEDFQTLSKWELPYAKWYLGGKLNVAYNCVDRHVEAGVGDRVAYHWEGEPGDTRTITYAELQRDVVRMANALRELGVRRGTPVAIYMGMIPELAIAMLACTRLGAPHTVVFGGFSADSLSGRMVDMGCEVLVTQDEAWRRGKTVPLKETADEAMEDAPGLHSCLVVRRTGNDVPMRAGRDRWFHELDVPDDPKSCPCEPMDSEDLLFLMYTSGTTAKPKGIAHTTGGYLVGVSATHHYIFDLKPETDVYWCAADIGWITGHSYIVYGPLCNATTSVLYEGTPDFPDHARWWSIVERYGVTILYTAPTAIRTHMKWGPEHAAGHDLGSLRLLGSVGEPINPEAWMWYHEHIGGGRCPVVDTWWQTETGMILITPLPGVTTTKPGSATKPFPGIAAAVLNEQGERVEQGGGYLVLERPWPAMTRGIFGDDNRYRATYWERFPGFYFAGDGARIDADGDFWLLGRVDDVMNVSGHRISTIEVESALVDHPRVAEAAVCGRSDAATGQAIVAYVTLKGSDPGSLEMLEELREHVSHKIGADREAGEHRLHAGAAQDPLGEDHASPAPRRRGAPAAGGHDDAGRPCGRERDRRACGRRRPGRRLDLVPFHTGIATVARSNEATVRATASSFVRQPTTEMRMV